jgi:hypothetical protein
MTDSDLIVLAPWLIFAVALAIICVQLRWPRRPARRRRPEHGTRAPEYLPQHVSDDDHPRSCSG